MSSHSSIKELSIKAAPQLEMEGNYGVPLGTGLMEIIKRGETVMQIHVSYMEVSRCGLNGLHVHALVVVEPRPDKDFAQTLPPLTVV